MDEPVAVSVVIPTRNEERNLPHCLARLARFAEVVVVDSASTDGTRQIARDAGAGLVDFQWNGRFPKKRNWVLRNYDFACDWVLFLDADEYVDDAFINEVDRTVSRTDCAGFYLTYQSYFLGRLLAHGDRFRKLALIRRGSGEYEYIADEHWSDLDMEVHEHPIIDGPVGVIRTPIRHEDFKGLNAYIRRHNEYSSWEARRYMRLREADRSEWKRQSLRQRIKYRLLDTWLLGPLYFTYCFILRLGLLDGRAGFIFALMKMQYFWQIKAKIVEARLQSHCQSDADHQADAGNDTDVASDGAAPTPPGPSPSSAGRDPAS